MNLLESFQSNQEWLGIQQIAFVERKDNMKLFFQLCGACSPRLDFPHRRTALIMILFMLLFLASRAPHDIYEKMKMFSVEYGGEGGHHAQGHVSSDCPIERGQRSE